MLFLREYGHCRGLPFLAANFVPPTLAEFLRVRTLSLRHSPIYEHFSYDVANFCVNLLRIYFRSMRERGLLSLQSREVANLGELGAAHIFKWLGFYTFLVSLDFV